MSLHTGRLRAHTSLLSADIDDTEDLLAQPELLINIEEQPGLAVERWRVAREQSPGWSQGVLELHYGDVLLTDARNWDDLWPLWAYLVAMIDDYLSDGVGQCAFPTRDIHVVLRDRDNETFFTVGDIELDVHKDSLVRQLLDAAEVFFTFVLETGESAAEDEIEFIAEVREKL
jgi:hypothetical protein